MGPFVTTDAVFCSAFVHFFFCLLVLIVIFSICDVRCDNALHVV